MAEADKEEFIETNPIGFQQSPDLIKWQLSPELVIAELEYNLRGYTWDHSQDKYVKRGRPKMNDAGVQNLSSILKSRLNKNVILSNLSETDILRMAEETRQHIIDFIYLNYHNYDIKFHDFNDIVQMTDHLIYSTLRRALNEGERKYLGRTQSRTERILRTPDGAPMGAKKGGFLSFFRK